MKKVILFLCTLLTAWTVNAQTGGQPDVDYSITLIPFVPQQVEQMPDAARSNLENKLNQLVLTQGVAGGSVNDRFIITANVVVLSKDVTATVPPKQAYTLEVTCCIGDGVDGKKFAVYSMTVKGVGATDVKAYQSALKNIRVNDPGMKDFIAKGKNEIINYYNANVDRIIREAETYAGQNNYEAAMYVLAGIPSECTEAKSKAQDIQLRIYQKYIDRESLIALNNAKNVWNAHQDAEGAKEVAGLLSVIDPSASCYNDAVAFTLTVAKRVKELDQREWDFKLKQQQDGVDIHKETIRAAREVGVAYAKNQPKTVYKVVGWW